MAARAPTRWRENFLAHLAETSNITASAQFAGIAPHTAYAERRNKPEFAGKWRKALCEGYDNLEMELLYRLRSGIVSDADGKKFDNASGLRLLAAHRASVAEERSTHSEEGSDDVLASLNAKLSEMRKRALTAGRDVWAIADDDDG
jgi:phage terminase small subunit